MGGRDANVVSRKSLLKSIQGSILMILTYAYLMTDQVWIYQIEFLHKC